MLNKYCTFTFYWVGNLFYCRRAGFSGGLSEDFEFGQILRFLSKKCKSYWLGHERGGDRSEKSKSNRSYFIGYVDLVH